MLSKGCAALGLADVDGKMGDVVRQAQKDHGGASFDERIDLDAAAPANRELGLELH